MQRELNVDNNCNFNYTISWKKIVANYQTASISRSTWQILNTLVPYIALWVAMYYCSSISFWLVLPLAVLSGGFLVRLFIIFHDCCHGAFFKTRVTNNVWGFILGVLTFTPYYHWRWEHTIHHANSGNLDKRGTGDIWTITVQEYLDASYWKKFCYRISRNPVVLFLIAPALLFIFWQRRPNPRAPKRERMSVHYTNLALLFLIGFLGYFFGWNTYFAIQAIVTVVGGAAGIWLFYVQHQYDGVYWARNDQWNNIDAALKGSSFYKLPKIFQWFSGNIGFHHVHHLSSRVPNYFLEKCHNSSALFQTVKPITLFASRKSLQYRFWDEQTRKLVGYRVLSKYYAVSDKKCE